MKKIIVMALLGLVLAGMAVWCVRNKAGDRVETIEDITEPDTEKHGARIPVMAQNVVPVMPEVEDQADSATMSAEEKQAEAEERQVEAFDSLTDKWMEPSSQGVTMADVDIYIKTFKRLPKDRQDECIHRALNLIPDGNVVLLVALLMDKSVDKEIAETIFNDILNRDEDVKKPVLQQIFKDKSHVCWADTAWILDVTGEVPKDRPQ